jgi:hypothetical protein
MKLRQLLVVLPVFLGTVVISFLGAYHAPAEAQTVSFPARVPPGLQPYIDARPITDYSSSELTAAFPELEALDFAQEQGELAMLLDKVGTNVEAFFQDFRNTACLERVHRESLLPNGDWKEYFQEEFNYLLSVPPDAKGLGLEEYRSDSKGRQIDPRKLKGSFMLTSGYACYPLYFHPKNLSGSVFRYLGREKLHQGSYVMAFAQRPAGARMMGSVTLNGIPVLILEQGLAWIDPESYQISRMRTDLLAPRSDVGLHELTTSIAFDRVHFSEASQTLWLPREVVVTIKWEVSVFRNRHRYSGYRLFSVQSRDSEKKIIRPRESQPVPQP